MKKIFLFLALCCVIGLYAAEKKVLTIGNSFTWSLREHFPAIAKAQGDTLTLAFANHGGCSIQRHWKYVSEEEADPAKKYYSLNGKKAKLREVLASTQWDIVTIQQASSKSWIKGSFYPELDNLVAYVKKHAPKSQIVFQQTWSYRSDSSLYKRKKIDQNQMFEGIDANYKEASKKFGLEVIPTGLAVQIARAEQKEKFIPSDPAARKNLKVGQNLVEKGSFCTGWIWKKNKKTGKKSLVCDPNHLNSRGRYLQACVWYGFVFKKSPLEIKYNGQFSPEEAAFLRQCAAKSLRFFSK